MLATITQPQFVRLAFAEMLFMEICINNRNVHKDFLKISVSALGNMNDM